MICLTHAPFLKEINSSKEPILLANLSHSYYWTKKKNNIFNNYLNTQAQTWISGEVFLVLNLCGRPCVDSMARRTSSLLTCLVIPIISLSSALASLPVTRLPLHTMIPMNILLISSPGHTTIRATEFFWHYSLPQVSHSSHTKDLTWTRLVALKDKNKLMSTSADDDDVFERLMKETKCSRIFVNYID